MPFRIAFACVYLLVHPIQAQQWRLVEEWRVGGEVEGAHSFQDVRALELLPNGGLVVLEFKDQQLHFLDARGRQVRTVGRQGAGPGEYQNANGLVILPNGNLVINDPDNNRFTILGPTGDFIRSVPMDHTRSFGGRWNAWADSQGRVGEHLFMRRGQGGGRARQLWSPDFARSDTLFSVECPPAPVVPVEDRSYSFRSAQGGMSMMIPYTAPRAGFLQTPEGGSWGTRWPDFAVITHTSAGACTPDVTIALAGPRVAIPTAVRDSAVARVNQAASRYGPPGPDLDKIPRTFPMVDVIQLDQDGQLWVARQVGATQKQFEVYLQNGRRLASLDMPPTLEPMRPMIISADRVYGFITDEDDLPYLVAYRIVK